MNFPEWKLKIEPVQVIYSLSYMYYHCSNLFLKTKKRKKTFTISDVDEFAVIFDRHANMALCFLIE